MIQPKAEGTGRSSVCSPTISAIIRAAMSLADSRSEMAAPSSRRKCSNLERLRWTRRRQRASSQISSWLWFLGRHSQPPHRRTLRMPSRQPTCSADPDGRQVTVTLPARWRISGRVRCRRRVRVVQNHCVQDLAWSVMALDACTCPRLRPRCACGARRPPARGLPRQR